MSDKLYDFGNFFLQINKLLAQFNPVMEEHSAEELKIRYLEKDI